MDKIEERDWPDLKEIYQNNYMEPYIYEVYPSEANLRFLAEKINELIDLCQK